MAKRTKTDAFDWAAIQWARTLEEKSGGADEFERVDAVARAEAERDARGRLLDPTAFLSVRASAILAAVGVSFERFRERAKRVWLFSLLFVVALGACVFPFARADKILEDVNLAGPFVFFLLGQIFFLVASLIFVLIAAFQGGVRRWRAQTGERTAAERAVVRFSGLLGWLALSAIRWGAPVWSALAETKFFARRREARERRAASTEDAGEEATRGRTREAERLFWNLAFSKPRFLCFWSGLLSHLFWASCSCCVLLILVARMQGNRYDYCWRTSLEDASVVKTCVDFLGAPLAKLGAEVPTREDVDRLFDERRARPTDDATRAAFAAALRVIEPDFSEIRVERRMNAETRTRWSHFLLGVVLLWCVAPRCLLATAYYLLFRASLRDFRPDLKEPYFRDLLERVESYSTTIETDVREEDASETNAATAWDRKKTLREAVAEPVAVEEPVSVAEAVAVEEPVPVEEAVAVEEPVSVEESVSVAEAVAVEEPVSVAEAVAVEEPVPVEEPVSVAEPVPVEEAVAVEEPVSVEEAVAVEEPVSVEEAVAEPVPVEDAPTLAVALGFDATLADERWRTLFDAPRTPILFGDVAADFAAKKTFKIWAKERGADVALCAVATDVSLPPARQCVIFFRDVLAASCPKARVVVVLSGGEKLRRKFGKTSERGVAERIQDWTDALDELSRTTGVPFEPVFFDADLDLPEAREALRRRLNDDAGASETSAANVRRRSLAKWDAAAERVVAECRAIFNESVENREKGQKGKDGENVDGEERDRRRVARLCADIFAIYREEVERATASGVVAVERKEGGSSWRETLLARATAVVERSVESGRALGGDFVETCRANGLDRETIERKLADAVGLSAKMTAFCKNLSPRCALAVGALGVSVPVVATFAPLLAGAASTAAIASTLGSLGTLLPSTLASGATGAALGAVAPTSLAACKRKLVERWRGGRTDDATETTGAIGTAFDSASSETPNAFEPSADGVAAEPVAVEAVESATALVCGAATWTVALELQGWPEDKIVAALPVALRPVEAATFDSAEAAREALAQTREEIRKLREKSEELK